MHGRLMAGVAIFVVLAALVTNNALLVRLAYILLGILACAAFLTWSSVRWVDIRRQTRATRS